MKYSVIALAAVMGMAVMPGNIINGRQMQESAEEIVTSGNNIDSQIQTGTLNYQSEKKEKEISDAEMFERTVGIVKDFESLHKARHWPYVGYGHRARKGDGYVRGVELSEREAERLLRKDLRKYLDMYDEYGRDAYLLAALAYNCGHGRVDRSQVLQKIKCGDRQGVRRAYLSHSRAGGRFLRRLHDRRLAELEALFIP